MAESKQKKLDTGKALLDSYQRDKERQCKTNYGKYTEFNSVSHDNFSDPRSSKVTADEVNVKMDVAALHKKVTTYESMSKRNKELQGVLTEKNKTVEALQLENQVLLHGHGDHPNLLHENNKVIKELHSQVEGREIYIKQLSDSLQCRSNELEMSRAKEEQLTKEIMDLKQKINSLTNQFEQKVSDATKETIQYKAKVDVLTNQIKEYSELVKSLKESLDSNNKKILAQQVELGVKDKKLDELKQSASEQVKQLMKDLEKLNLDLSFKEKILAQTKKEMESLQCTLEEKFGHDMMILRKELEKKYKEDLEQVELLYDGMLLEQVRKTEDLRAVEKCNELEAEVSSVKISHEQEARKHKEELTQLLLRNKATEEHLLQELEMHKQQAEHYRQQVENVENKLSEEVQKIKADCYSELDRYSTEINEQISCDRKKMQHYQIEIENLSAQLREQALKEASAEVDLETHRNELEKSAENIRNLLDSFNSVKSCNEQLKLQLSQLEERLQWYKESNFKLEANLRHSLKIEQQLKSQLSLSAANLQSYEQRVSELNERCENDKIHFEKEYDNAVRSFEKKINQLVVELDKNRKLYGDEIAQLTNQNSEQQEVIKDLEDRIAHLLRLTRTDYNSFEEQGIPQQNDSEQVNKLQNDNKELYMKVLIGLRKVKNNIESLIHPNITKTSDGLVNEVKEEELENIDHGLLIQELEKTVSDILNITQSLQVSDENLSLDATSSEEQFFKCVSPKMITSTPHVKYYFSNGLLSQTESPSSEDIVNFWIEKCKNLESENKQLSHNLTLLRQNANEMEILLTEATEKSKTYDEKFKSFDTHITELGSLQKENNLLNKQLMCMKENEIKLLNQLEITNEKYTKLEKQANKSLYDLQSKLASENESNGEMQRIITDLKEKADEIMYLRSQVETLQKSEKELKQRALDIQSKFASLVASHERLAGELVAKKEDIESLRQENENIVKENQALFAKLKLIQGKHHLHCNESNFGIDSTNVKKHSCVKSFNQGKDNANVCSNFDLNKSRLETMNYLSSSHMNRNNYAEKNLSRTAALNEEINYEVQLLAQDLGNVDSFCLPTIPEEEFEDSSALTVSYLQNNLHY